MEQTRNYATKQEGITEADPFWELKDMHNVINYFKQNEKWDSYLIFMLASLTGRRIGDVVMFKWSDFFNRDGSHKMQIRTLKEQKTGKYIKIPIPEKVFESFDCYCDKKKKYTPSMYNEYIFSHPSKTDWINRKGDPIYKENDLEKWCKFLNKDFKNKRKEHIIEDFEKQKIKKSKKEHQKIYYELGEYLYYEVEYADVIKWQTDNFRKELKKAAEFANIKYPVSCHTLRKSMVFWSLMTHPNDPQGLYIMQDLCGHATPEITLAYAGLSDKRKKKYLDDYGEMISRVEDGNSDVMINNSTVSSLRHEDISKILMYAIQSKENQMETFSKAMNMVDKLKIKYI